ncbi:hypothetical protein AJ80_01574 [Polytolypa hystricis UAMH7299]|uniref:Signal peptidase complex subunit 2 n=1 Tax=Polytolypa hystricis (strain UAMH7299) TaxID=1447883 RepID=A0A2B7Z103_POLH7|nr:hypothetical protein AJ80_01574 [Polytolypa hystricis UAMH7299]
MASSTTIPVYSLADLKNTTDDAITPYLTNLPKPTPSFTVSNFKSNVRLALGYSAVAISGVSFYIDRKHGWQATQAWIVWAVAVYFALNLALTAWIWGVEAGQVFEGSRGGETLQIRSSTKKKYSPIYTLTINHTSPTGEIRQNSTVSAPFTQWFSAGGTFHREPFREWLASEIKALNSGGEEKKKR